MAYSDFFTSGGGSAQAQTQAQAQNLDPEQLYRLGVKRSTGTGSDYNLVLAHMYFNLAAAQGHAEARRCRKELADQMTSAEIAEAQRAAREWSASGAAPRLSAPSGPIVPLPSPQPSPEGRSGALARIAARPVARAVRRPVPAAALSR